MNTSILKQEWFGNVRGDVLSGIVVALALIPEAIAFSIIAGVDPMVGLYASFCIAIVISFVGGRPGMISAATGAMALVMVDLVKDHGLNYLLAKNNFNWYTASFTRGLQNWKVNEVYPEACYDWFCEFSSHFDFHCPTYSFRG